MKKIVLRDYQQNAAKFAINIKKCLWFVSAGAGKTLSSVFTGRYLYKNKMIDKIVIVATPSATTPFIKDAEKLGIKLSIIELVEDFKKAVEGDDKIILIKHSMIKDIGLDEENIQFFKKSLTKNYKKILLIIDEAHEMNNYDSIVHGAYQKIYFMWDRIIAMTATPWSSSLLQVLGMMCLVRPEKYYKYLSSAIKEFKQKYIVEEEVKDWRGKFLRMDPVEYINISGLRKELESFTYFYFPKINLKFFEYTTELKDYKEYDSIIKIGLEKNAKDKSKSTKSTKYNKEE